MYNPYENNNREPEHNNPQDTQDTNNQNNIYENNNINNASPIQEDGSYRYTPPVEHQNSYYTWGSEQNTNYVPPQAPLPPQNEKKAKSGTKTWVKVMAGALCCAFSAAVSVGAFVVMIQSGVINVESGTDGNSAFTITKIIDESATQTTTSSTGVLTPEEISDKVVPSVVAVQAFAPTSQGFMGGQSSEPTAIGEGSGIVMTEDGYIVTNQHVIADATSYKVVLHNGDTYEATLVGQDEVTDLALLKIEATGLTPAEFGSADDLSVGEQVVAIGNPGGVAFSSTVTVGYVSGLNREVTSDSGYTMNYIQTDAAISPGNSGGALVNEYGQVIGINTIKIVAEGYESLGFAIPTEVAQPIISDLREYGYVYDRAIVGISGQYLDAMTASFYGLSSGMYVAEVTTEEAVAAGLKEGDIITHIDDVEVTTAQTITSLVTTKSPGDTVTLTVDRQLEGKIGMEITVTLAQYERVIANNPVDN